jgi:uncharacterized membrane protein YhaH (DUF805 family)
LSFDGRLARLPYFARGFFLAVLAGALFMVSIPLFARDGVWWWFGLLDVMASLLFLSIGTVSLIVRRLHDLGWSGYHAIWVTAAMAGWAVLSHGSPRMLIAGLPLAVVGAWLVFWPGNKSSNRFGDVPA